MAKQQATVLGVDTARSFREVRVHAVEPRLAFKSDQQDTTKDGRKKWDVTCGVSMDGPFGSQHTMLKVGFIGDQPQVEPGSLVELVGLQIGYTPDGESAPWFRVEEVRSLAATGPRSSGKPAEPKAAAEAA